MAQHYRDLIAWQKAMDLVESVYKLTEGFPKREVYSLTDQIRRAAVSIPSNIAEGQAHFTNREFVHYLRHSLGSLAELENTASDCATPRIHSAEPSRHASKAN